MQRRTLFGLIVSSRWAPRSPRRRRSRRYHSRRCSRCRRVRILAAPARRAHAGGIRGRAHPGAVNIPYDQVAGRLAEIPRTTSRAVLPLGRRAGLAAEVLAPAATRDSRISKATCRLAERRPPGRGRDRARCREVVEPAAGRSLPAAARRAACAGRASGAEASACSRSAIRSRCSRGQREPNQVLGCDAQRPSIEARCSIRLSTRQAGRTREQLRARRDRHRLRRRPAPEGNDRAEPSGICLRRARGRVALEPGSARVRRGGRRRGSAQPRLRWSPARGPAAAGREAPQDHPAVEGRGHAARRALEITQLIERRAGLPHDQHAASTSLWPPRYFVVLCMTRSAPKSNGRCSTGLAKVLSQASSAPRSWPGGRARRCRSP